MAILENCPTCGNATSENASICPACGEPLKAGWAKIVQDEREHKADEKIRIELEETAKAKKAKRKKWKIIFSLILGVFLFINISEWYDDYKIRQMKENEPEEYQKFIEQLEDEVAKVPSENYDRNLILYKELNDLEPENELYSSKISFYETKRDEAIAAEKRRKEQEKLAEIQAEEKRKQRELEEEAAAKAENVRKGFHCLSGWDGSHAGVKKYVEDNLKDPDSFEHVETRITPVNDNGTHTLSMRYRARNGFGGMTIGIAIATIQNSGCGATIMSVE